MVEQVLPHANAATDTADDAAEDRQRSPRWIVGATLAAVALFYALTSAHNLSEPDDAFYFAWKAEHSPALQFNDPRLLLYHLLARLVWLGGQVLLPPGLQPSGLWVLRAMSLVGAVLCLFFTWRVLAGRLGLPRAAAVGGCAALGSSYAFWRYATEADVYVPAMAFSAAVLWGLLGPRPQPLRWGLVAGVGVLLYQPSALPLLLAFACLAFVRWGWRAALIYLLTASAVLFAGYAAAYGIYWPEPATPVGFQRFLAQRAQEFNVPPLGLRMVAISAVHASMAFGHDLLATQWAMGLAPVEALVRRVLPAHDLDSEVFLARAGGALVWAGAASCVLVLASACRLAWLRWCLPTAPAAWRGLAPALLPWLGLTLLVNGRLNASGAEAWSVLLLPLWLLLTVTVFAPVVRQRGRGPVLWLVLALALHNAVGGMAFMHRDDGDLADIRSRWLVREATAADLVLVSANLPLADSLRYYGRAPVAMVSAFDTPRLTRHLMRGEPLEAPVMTTGREFAGVPVVSLVARAHASGGRVLVHDAWFSLSRPLAASRPDRAAEMAALREQAAVRHVAADGSAIRELVEPPSSLSLATLQAAPGQWPGPSPGTASPPDCPCPGSAPQGGCSASGPAKPVPRREAWSPCWVGPT
jgi:hypothetical protein